MAELERERKEESKKYEMIKHKWEQTNADKEVLKRQLDTVKTKLKQQEVNEVKQTKVLALNPIAAEDPQANVNSMAG